jgi:hypothetical protein
MARATTGGVTAQTVLCDITHLVSVTREQRTNTLRWTRLGIGLRHKLVNKVPQSSYHALQTPYSFFGLGRTNNYIENLFVGTIKLFPFLVTLYPPLLKAFQRFL